MLQIITGKFFGEGPRHEHEGKALTFSNLLAYSPLETCVARLEATSLHPSVVGYIIEYKNQIEKNVNEKQAVLIRTGDAEIVEQFQVLLCFGLRSLFHQEQNAISHLCRQNSASQTDGVVPASLLPRYFDKRIRCAQSEMDFFPEFVGKVMGLRRETYNILISALRNFRNALEIVGSNFDLAYSMLVYSLESLSQTYEHSGVDWEDYPMEVRDPLESIFTRIDVSTAQEVRSVLLRSMHLKTMARFVSFVVEHVTDAFFIEESPIGGMSLRKSHLVPALRNAYDLRSRYAHQLERIQRQLLIPEAAKSDVFQIFNRPYLTFAGLARLAHHCILNFIDRQEKVTHEQVNWRAELPGVLMMQMAPHYWIWNTANIHILTPTKRLSALLEQVQDLLRGKGGINDLRPVFEEYRKLFDHVDRKSKTHMLVTYKVANALVAEELRSTVFTEIWKDLMHY